MFFYIFLIIKEWNILLPSTFYILVYGLAYFFQYILSPITSQLFIHSSNVFTLENPPLKLILISPEQSRTECNLEVTYAL